MYFFFFKTNVTYKSTLFQGRNIYIYKVLTALTYIVVRNVMGYTKNVFSYCFVVKLFLLINK